MEKKGTRSDARTQEATDDALPDAWERFEQAVDVVVKAKPAHRTTKERLVSKGRVGKARSRS